MTRACGRALLVVRSAAALSAPPEHATMIVAAPRGTPSMSYAAAARAATPVASVAARDAFDLAADFTLFDRFTLVVRLLPSPKAQLDFHEAALEIGAQRDEGEPFFLERAGKALYLARVQEQLAIPIGLVLREKRAALVRRDADVHEPCFAAAQTHETVAKAAAVRAQALHLRARERDARLESVDEGVLVKRPPIRRDRLDAVLSHRRRALRRAPPRTARAIPRTPCRPLPRVCRRSQARGR